MKRILLGSTAIALLASIGAASAADLPTRKGPPVAPAYIPPAFTWTGFYAGVNAGYGWANNNNKDLAFGAIPVGGLIGGGNGDNGGFVGGAQVGYNWQFGVGQGVVVGGEADIDWADFGKRNNLGAFTFASTPGTTFYAGSSNNSGNYIGTARLRLGYGWDRFLVYATGGLAYGDIGRRNNGAAYAITSAGSVNPFTSTVVAVTTTTFTSNGSSTRAGWTVGGGFEYAVMPNWTVKAEYLYYNLGHSNNNLLPAVINTGHRDNNGNIARVGLNYKFW